MIPCKKKKRITYIIYFVKVSLHLSCPLCPLFTSCVQWTPFFFVVYLLNSKYYYYYFFFKSQVADARVSAADLRVVSQQTGQFFNVLWEQCRLTCNPHRIPSFFSFFQIVRDWSSWNYDLVCDIYSLLPDHHDNHCTLKKSNNVRVFSVCIWLFSPH